MTGYVSHLSYDLKAGVRDKSLMLMNYLFPIGFFLMIGMFMPRINPDFLNIMVPGMILFAIMSGTLMTIPFTLIGNREGGILRSFRVNGVPATALITIPIIGMVIHMAITSAVLTVASSLLYGGVLPTRWFAFVGVFALTALCFATLGVLIGIIANSARNGTLIAQAIYVPSVMLGGLMVPEQLLPDGLRAGASILPATHAMRAFNSLALAGERLSAATSLPVIVLTASIAINVVLCFLLFQWDSRPIPARRRLLALLALVPFAVSIVAV